MPNELSYPGLKCVLEFLEANKRIHISSRCPRLKHIERCVPIYLNTLNYRISGVTLNEMTYEIDEKEVFSRMYPAIEFSKQVSISKSIGVGRRVREKEGVRNYDAIRKLLRGLIGRRKEIRVDRLVIQGSLYRLPSDFKVRIRKLNSGYINPEYLLPLIDSTSFPLKEIRPRYLERLDHAIVQSSEKLVIEVFDSYVRDNLIDIHKLPNRSVIIEFELMRDDPYSIIIDYWLYKKRETGKCFMINGNKRGIMRAAFDLKKKYNGKMVKWNGTEFSSSPNTNYISVPLNEDFVIGVYVVTHRDDIGSTHQFVIKTMPIDSFIPAEDFSELKTLVEIEYPEQNDLFVVFAFLLILLLAFLYICYLIFYKSSPTAV